MQGINKTGLKLLLGVFAFFSLSSPAPAQETDQLIVHEWGTITSQHLSDGKVEGSLNRIRPEEVLPDFVHQLHTTLAETRAHSKSPRAEGSNAVTMRLETPVLYFYPHESFDFSRTIDVDVEFHGGLINEYYPYAVGSYQGSMETDNLGLDLNEDTVGTLSWRGLKIGGPVPIPETDFGVWLAPRKPRSAYIRTASGEAEKYLFYRGVANLNSLLRSAHTQSDPRVTLFNPKNLPLLTNGSLQIPALWILRTTANGRLAYRELDSLILSNDSENPLASVSVNFGPNDYSSENFQLLRHSMIQALMKDGLFQDEAEAMLDTWDRAYFRNPGTRLLFIVPKAWTDAYLPLKISVPARIERVMVGRIDFMGL